MAKIKDMSGLKFSKLTVIKIAYSDNGLFWECLCECGKTKAIKGNYLRRGIIKSCGCLWKEQIKANFNSGRDKKSHGFPHGRKLKDLYKNMINRCYDPKNNRWANYGGRGIIVCEEWLKDRRGFYKWAIDNGFNASNQIDREDVNGNYEPSNCRFVDIIVQANNKTDSHLLTWQDKTQSATLWAREIGCNPSAIIHRSNGGWSMEEIFTIPIRRNKNSK